MKMKQQRHYRDDSPIYGDPNLGDWNDYQRIDESRNAIDLPYEMVWPDGYWTNYEQLKSKAQDISRAISLNVVVGKNRKYYVYALLSMSTGRGGTLRGPEADDRIGAWDAFIAVFAEHTVTESTPVTSNPKLTIQGLKAHQEWAKSAAPAFDAQLTDADITKYVPKKGKKDKP